jgi:hypothetical protein
MHRLPAFRIDWSREVPSAIVLDTRVLAAILATVQIDHWRHATFRPCAKPGCWRLFEARGTNKIFCSDKCAKHQSLRRYRAKKSEAGQQRKKKPLPDE